MTKEDIKERIEIYADTAEIVSGLHALARDLDYPEAYWIYEAIANLEGYESVLYDIYNNL